MPLKWQHITIAAILASQLLVESLHLFFYNVHLNTGYTLGDHIYWLSSRLFSAGVLPSLFIWIKSKSRLSNSLSLALLMFSVVKAAMEVEALSDIALVTEMNSAHYAGLVYLSLCLIFSFVLNGVYRLNSYRLTYRRLLFQGYKQPEKRTERY